MHDDYLINQSIKLKMFNVRSKTGRKSDVVHTASTELKGITELSKRKQQKTAEML